MGSLFERWISKAGSTTTTRTLNKKTGKFSSKTTTKRSEPKKTSAPKRRKK